MPHNKSLEHSRLNLVHQTRFRSQSLWSLSDAGRVLNSMLGSTKVLSKHIVDRILSTSLTLFWATFSPRGEPDALEAKVSDGREG